MAQEEISPENNNNNKSDDVVHSVLTMVSSTPVNRAGRRSYPLSPLDRAMAQHTLHVIFYYRSGSFKFDRIRASFNEILTLYPNVTGRLWKDGEGNWEVKFTDAGVRVYLGKVKCSVDEWLRSSGADDETHLTVHDEFPDDPQFWSPFKLQVTEFEGGGTAIGLSCPHMLADPITITLFVKAWTDTYHQDLITYPPFLSPVTLIDPAQTADVIAPPAYCHVNSRKSNSKPSLKMGSATFCFTESTIKKSLSEIASVVPGATPFDLLTALFWTRIARGTSTVHNSEKTITVCIDMRKHLSAPLPCGYFGNAMYFSNLTLTDNDMEDGRDIGKVTEKVHRLVTGVTEDEFFSSVKWLDSRKDSDGKCEPAFKMYGPELTCVNMEHMVAPFRIHGKEYENQSLMYMASFDKDQKPAHVSYHVGNVDGEGLILVMPSPEGRLARRVTVTLPEVEIRKLLKDDVILGLNPALMLCSRN